MPLYGRNMRLCELFIIPPAVLETQPRGTEYLFLEDNVLLDSLDPECLGH